MDYIRDVYPNFLKVH